MGAVDEDEGDPYTYQTIPWKITIAVKYKNQKQITEKIVLDKNTAAAA